jgi:hypothetical protein
MDEKNIAEPTVNEILDILLLRLNRDKTSIEIEKLFLETSIESGILIWDKSLIHLLVKRGLVSMRLAPTDETDPKAIYVCKIHPEGSRFIENGGFVKRNKDMIETKYLNKEKLMVDLANAKKVLKSYPSTQIIAWVSLAIALSLLFLQVTAALKLWPYNK